MNDSHVNMNVFYADYIPELNETVRIRIMNDAMPALIENMNGMPFEYTLEIMKAGMPEIAYHN